ncbi:DUF2800 domain-containing protein [Clostridium celatum]|uniref:DUF2800 domain-containing protein n=1 Tax=Clostridium celatum TaxID=36834 RepID=UPI00319D8E09
MANKELLNKVNEEHIKELTILKLKRHLDIISKYEFNNKIKEFNVVYGSSDFVEDISIIAFRMILSKIEKMKKEDNIEIIFNELVNIRHDDFYIKRMCDVVLVGKNTIEVIKIIPLEINFIYAFEDLEIKLLGLGIIDKYLGKIDINNIRLTIVQPNLMMSSIYEIEIISFLHDLDLKLE